MLHQRTRLLSSLLVTLAATATLAANACSSTNDTGGGAGTDAGTSSGDPVDGGGGGGGDGGGGGGDGGGGQDAEVDTGSACDTATSVCDDFDKSTSIHPKWTPTASGGSVSVVAQGLSAPNALAVVVNAGGAAAYIERALAFASKVRCEMDMKIEAMPTQGDLDLFSITTKAATSDYYVYFAHSAAGYLLGEFSEQLPGGSSVDRKEPIAAPPTGSWFKVVLAVDGATATLTANGVTSTLTGLAQPSGATRNVQVGAPFSQSTEAGSRVLYDNVLCTYGK
ncbi:MAG: hypothetical protein JST00_16765 [Deltaproteobacteria bacterium]|nr:hypothetical protein [Deltaproteobacteria bacterium]